MLYAWRSLPGGVGSSVDGSRVRNSQGAVARTLVRVDGLDVEWG